jgi:hypothetical protein
MLYRGPYIFEFELKTGFLQEKEVETTKQKGKRRGEIPQA